MVSGYSAMPLEPRGEAERRFCDLLKENGVDFATGVPCGVQKYIISFLSSDPQILHVSATRESEAIGIAAGAYLGGRTSVIYMQNSGLMNSINDITSLLIAYRIPVFFSISWRGAPGENAPQHLVNGRITRDILSIVGIPYCVLTKKNMERVVGKLFRIMRKESRPAGVLIVRGALR